MTLRKITPLACMMLISVSCNKSNQDSQTENVKEYPVMTLHRQNANMQIVYPATIKGQEDIEIKPRIDGFIEAIYVDEGAVVKAGQVLFRINSPSSEQALVSARASVTSAEAQVNIALTDVERIRPLAEKGIVSAVQLQTYQNTYQATQAALEQAKAALKNAEASMSWTSVTSPVDGVVGSIPYRTGSLVNSTNTLTTIANTKNVYAYFSLNEKALMSFLDNLEGKTQAEKIVNIPSVTLLMADGTEYAEKGKIETITGLVDITTGSANLRAEFPNRYGQLRSGTSGKIVIPETLQDVFIIPQKATFQLQDKVMAYVLQGDTTVQKMISVIPMPDGQNYAVTGGLKDGDKIVLDGVATLSNGIKIAYNEQTEIQEFSGLTGQLAD